MLKSWLVYETDLLPYRYTLPITHHPLSPRPPSPFSLSPVHPELALYISGPRHSKYKRVPIVQLTVLQAQTFMVAGWSPVPLNHVSVVFNSGRGTSDTAQGGANNLWYIFLDFDF